MIKNALKSLFFMLSIREQRLCLLLIFTCLFIWTKEQFKDFQLKAKNFEQVVVDLESQNLWKENEATIDQNLADRILMYEADKTFSAVQLVSKMDELTKSIDSKPTLPSPRSKEGNNFNIHTQQVSFNSMRMDELIGFYSQLKSLNPYITLKNFQVSSNTKNPELLNVNLVLRSFELNKDIR